MDDSSSGRIHGTLFENSGARLAAEPDALTRGATLSRYLLVEQVGVGGMGVVWAAYDPELDRKVAIKLLRPRVARGPRELAQTRLIREAQVMAQLSHPNVIAIHDVGTHAGHVFLAMEFVQGKTLGRWVRSTRREWREIVAVFVQAGRGLAEAHRIGLVHRDFKPANVLVDAEGRARVTDFGLARAVASPGSADPPDSSAFESIASSLTQTGSLLGTPAYMAPEQFDGGEFDARGDQFGFCVALWEALYGRRPFAGQTLASLSEAVHRHAIEPPPYDARIPDPIERALRRGLAVDPAERWPSMDALLDALAHELVREPSRDRRGWWIAGGVVSSFTAAVLLGPILFDRSREGEADSCAAVSDIWDPQRRQALGRVRLDAGTLSPERWARIGDALDHYANTHAAARAIGCEPGPRARCLDERYEAFAVTLTLLESDDRSLLDGAHALLEVLPPIDACESERYLARFEPTLDDPSRARRRTRLHQRLLTARAQAAGREPERAAEALRELAATARVEPAVWIAATIELGELERRAKAPERAREQLERAVAEAIRAGEDELAGRAAVLLIEVVGRDLGDPELGLRWAGWAEAWHDRIAAPTLPRAQRSVAEGQLRRALGQPDAAARLQLSALSLLGVGEHELGPAQVDVAVGRAAASAMRELAELARAGAQDSSARVWLEAVATLYGSSLIATARDVVVITIDLARVDAELGDWATAERRFADGLARARGCSSPCSDLATIAAFELARHRVRRAELQLEPLEAAAAALEAATIEFGQLGPSASEQVTLERARVERLRGRFELAESTLAGLDGPHARSLILAVTLERGELYLAKGEPERALAEFERAAATHGITRGPSYAEAIAGRGRALAQTGRDELGAAELVRALAIWDALAPAGHPRAVPTLEQLAALRGPESDAQARAHAIRASLTTSPGPRDARAP